MNKIPKKEAEKQIEEFFRDIKDKTPKEIKKIRKISMRNSVKLRNLKKKFCKKCFSPYKNPKTRINKKIKSVACENCGYISRWKMKD